MEKEIKLICRFDRKEMTAEQYMSFCKMILNELHEFDNFFGAYATYDLKLNKKQYFDESLSNFEEIVFNQLYDDKIAYINEEPGDKNFYRTSISPFGFSNIYFLNSQVESNAGISLFVSHPTSHSHSNLIIVFPNENYPKFQELSYCKKLLKKVISLFDPYYAAIIPANFFKKIPTKKNTDLRIGWQTYFKNIEIAEYLPKDVQIEKANGGVFITLADDINSNITEDTIIQRVKRVKEILSEKGLLTMI